MCRSFFLAKAGQLDLFTQLHTSILEMIALVPMACLCAKKSYKYFSEAGIILFFRYFRAFNISSILTLI